MAHVYTPGLEQRDGLNGALHLMGVDALGSVRAFINDDSGQAVTDTQGYYGYGITRSRTGSDWMPFGFAGADGYQTDPNQLMLLGNREYHPFTGRFLTRDPAHAGDNDYEYADDNPLSYVDPSGLDFTDSNGNVWHDIGPSADPNVSRMVIGSGDDGESIIEAEGAGHPGAAGLLRFTTDWKGPITGRVTNSTTVPWPVVFDVESNNTRTIYATVIPGGWSSNPAQDIDFIWAGQTKKGTNIWYHILASTTAQVATGFDLRPILLVRSIKPIVVREWPSTEMGGVPTVISWKSAFNKGYIQPGTPMPENIW